MTLNNLIDAELNQPNGVMFRIQSKDADFVFVSDRVLNFHSLQKPRSIL